MIQNQNFFIMNNKGFSLIELMVVIVILGVLMAKIAPNFITRIDDSKIQKAKVDIVAIETGLKLYRVDNGNYPTTEQGLSALISPPETGELPKNWKTGGYLEKKSVPKDPWGNEFVYLSPGMNGPYDIISYGKDGMQGGEGNDKDINSWEIE